MYTIKEKVLKNVDRKKKVHVISFHDPKMAIVGEFLMTDAHLLNYQILADIEKVLLGELETIESSGQRTAVTIQKDFTKIEDLFIDLSSDISIYPTYEIETIELKKLIHMWRQHTHNK